MWIGHRNEIQRLRFELAGFIGANQISLWWPIHIDKAKLSHILYKTYKDHNELSHWTTVDILRYSSLISGWRWNVHLFDG